MSVPLDLEVRVREQHPDPLLQVTPHGASQSVHHRGLPAPEEMRIRLALAVLRFVEEVSTHSVPHLFLVISPFPVEAMQGPEWSSMEKWNRVEKALVRLGMRLLVFLMGVEATASARAVALLVSQELARMEPEVLALVVVEEKSEAPREELLGAEEWVDVVSAVAVVWVSLGAMVHSAVVEMGKDAMI